MNEERQPVVDGEPVPGAPTGETDARDAADEERSRYIQCVMRSFRRRVWWFRAALLFAVAMIVCVTLDNTVAVCVVFGCLLVCFAGFLTSNRPLAALARTASLKCEPRDVNLLVVLSGALYNGDRRTADMLKAALAALEPGEEAARQLPLLRGTLTIRSSAPPILRLVRRLGFDGAFSVELRVAEIEALARAGSEPDLAVLRRVAGSRTLGGAYRPMKEAAVRCVPEMEARLAAHRPAAMLVRASEPAEDDHLVRAAGQMAADANRLPRASDAGEGENP